MVHRVLAGSLCVVLTAAPWAPGAGRPDPDRVEIVSTQRFDVRYQLEVGTSPVDSVHLWYTTDDGVTWREYGVDVRATSAIPFNAAEEGLYGFYIVAYSQSGVSGPAPGPGTEPQHWVYVDYTPPVVRLYPPSFTVEPGGQRTVHIRWSVLERSLPARPIRLAYRTLPGGAWRDIDGPLANTGSYRWRLDPELSGAITIRVVVRDRGQHVVGVTSKPLTISPMDGAGVPAGSTSARKVGPANGSGPAAFTGEGAAAGDERRRARATKLYREGVVHALGGEYALAASRLGGALALEPTLTGALVKLGDVLYAQGKMDKAVDAYRLALQQKPGLRSGLHGLARVHISQHRFGEAVQELSRMIRANPNDVEAWLNLGDVAVYQGDELLALEHYNKAATLDPARVDIVGKARLRMADLKRLASGFQHSSP